MTPAAQEALVQVFRTFERHTRNGLKPSNALVFATVRALGHRFKDADAKVILAAFRPEKKFRPSPAPEAPPERPASAPEFEHERPSSAPEPPLVRTQRAGATRAGDKELLVPKKIASQSAGKPPGLFALPDPPVKPGSRQWTPEDHEADKALRAIWPRLHLFATTQTDWKRRNRAVVRSMIAAGMSGDEVIAAHGMILAPDGHPYHVMSKLQAAIERTKPPAAPPPTRPPMLHELRQREPQKA